jgi:AcrR family transcriptional regulator
MSVGDGGVLTARQRRPNRRGQGERLREDLIETAIRMIETDPPQPLSLRGLARQVGVAATSVYLHFPDVDHVRAAVVTRAFGQLTDATTRAAEGVLDPAEQLHSRCRAYCRFGLGHPNLYRVMFHADLPDSALAGGPAATPGRRSFDNLVAAVSRCLDAGQAPPHDDPFRLASLIWTAEHGLVLARISRPTFPWAPMDTLINEMVSHLMAFGEPRPPARRRGRLAAL